MQNPEKAQDAPDRPLLLDNLPVPDPKTTFTALGFARITLPEEENGATNA